MTASEILNDRCRPGHDCPQARELWQAAEDARDHWWTAWAGDVHHYSDVKYAEKEYRDHKNNCEAVR